MSNNPIEIEVKFYLKTPAAMHQRLRSLGAHPQSRTFEINTCYDDFQNRIAASDGVLRLRQDKACQLTLKRRPDVDDPDVKIYTELEVQVSDNDTMEKILGNLGYHPARRYEKWRQTYVLGNTQLCMDTLPFGDFLEIEDDKASIRQMADRLGLTWHKRILTNYLAIFDLLKKEAHLTFSDPTFKNFDSLAFPIESIAESIIEHFEAGP